MWTPLQTPLSDTIRVLPSSREYNEFVSNRTAGGKGEVYSISCMAVVI